MCVCVCVRMRVCGNRTTVSIFLVKGHFSHMRYPSYIHACFSLFMIYINREKHA